MKSRKGIICILVLLLLTAVAVQAQDTQPTPSSTGHAGHHTDEATEPSTPETPESADTGQTESNDMQSTLHAMSDMMHAMDTMGMSDEMMGVMQQMHNMMDMMMTTEMSNESMQSMMQGMSAMMDAMMAMDMPDEMRLQMEQMQSMMAMMMGNADMPGMDMSGMDMGGTATPDHAMSGMNMGGTPSPEAPMSGMDMGDSAGHLMEPISSEGVPAATESIGGQPLDYRLEDGVKVFEITTQPAIWNILDDVAVTAWTYNGTVPGPMIRVTEGDQVRILVTNNLPEPTTVHWHGIEVPNAMDGVPGITQEAIQPGETFIYEFVARPAGTFMYHSHFDSDVQVGLGLYAPFIIDPAEPEQPAPDVDVTLMLSEWRVVNGQTFAAMPMGGMEPNYFTINGKAFPATETINVQRGQRVRLRLIGIGQFLHPMHLHGLPFEVVATDGHSVPEGARLTKDTITVAPGERYDIEFVADEPGQWVFHCHILHHVTNDNVEPGGLTLILNVTE